MAGAGAGAGTVYVADTFRHRIRKDQMANAGAVPTVPDTPDQPNDQAGAARAALPRKLLEVHPNDGCRRVRCAS